MVIYVGDERSEECRVAASSLLGIDQDHDNNEPDDDWKQKKRIVILRKGYRTECTPSQITLVISLRLFITTAHLYTPVSEAPSNNTLQCCKPYPQPLLFLTPETKMQPSDVHCPSILHQLMLLRREVSSKVLHRQCCSGQVRAQSTIAIAKTAYLLLLRACCHLLLR